jgi:hypothetical protein
MIRFKKSTMVTKKTKKNMLVNFIRSILAFSHSEFHRKMAEEGA